MESAKLRRFAPLFQTARYLGADELLRRHLGVDSDYLLPLGLSHGVDFGQMYSVMDAHGIEPIYWAYNRELLEKVSGTKAAVAIPHPFLLAADEEQRVANLGTLVVGPPPGPTHDRDLLGLLRERDVSMLVKPKQNFGRSAQFWEENGVRVVSIVEDGPPTYEKIAGTLARYERIIGCTFSSVLFFAAAMGKPVDVIRGHRCRVWEVPDIEAVFDFNSVRARKIGRLFAKADYAAKTEACRAILGSELDGSPGAIRTAIEAAVASVEEPLNFASRYPKPVRAALSELALTLNRPGIVTRTWRDLASGLGRRGVILQDLDEVSLWVDGRAPDNPRLTRQRFVPGRTIPGDAVEGYPP